MIYEKPKITFQKFHTTAFLENTNVLSTDDPDGGWQPYDPTYDPNGGFISDEVFNGTISINSDGVGGWLNG